MTGKARSARPAFLIFAFSLLVAVATGAGWIGQPFRAVHLVMILGLGMAAGVSWSQAVVHLRRGGNEAAPTTGAVLYAKEMDRVARFYATLLGAEEVDRDGEHVHLVAPGCDLVIRQLSPAIAGSVRITAPPARREEVAVKMVFNLPNFESLRAAVDASGGVLDPAPKSWTFHGRQLWDATDPEGNVIQCRAPIA